MNKTSLHSRLLLGVSILLFCFLASTNALPVFAQSNQIQRLALEKQRRVYSLLDQIQNAHSVSEESALAVCNQAIAAFPHIGSFYLKRGEAYAGLNDFTHALADYHHARACDLMLANDSVDGCVRVYNAQKKYGLALKELDSLPVSALGFRGSPESRVFINEQIGKPELAKSTYLDYRNRMIAQGQWSKPWQDHFPQFANLAVEEPKPNTAHAPAVLDILKQLKAFDHFPSKLEIEHAAGIKLTPKKVTAGLTRMSLLEGSGLCFKISVYERNKLVSLIVDSHECCISAKDLLKALDAQSKYVESQQYYMFRESPSAPTMQSFQLTGEFKGLNTASFSWNVPPDSPVPDPNAAISVESSQSLLDVLKKIDQLPKPIGKRKLELITNCKLVLNKTSPPAQYSGMPQATKVVRFNSGLSSQNPYSVWFGPAGSYLNDARVRISSGSEKVTRQALEEIFGKGSETEGKPVVAWITGQARMVTFKRPYGSITTALTKDDSQREIASPILFWNKGRNAANTLEEFETARTSDVLRKQAILATRNNEFIKAAYLLRLAFSRTEFHLHSGQEYYQLWQRIRDAYVELYLKKGDKARANYLRNVTCMKMCTDMIDIESTGQDFPTLSESQNVLWRVEHAPNSRCYTVNGDRNYVTFYKSSSNYQKCVELFGPMDNGVDIFVKKVPVDLLDSEYFGPAYYD